MAVLGVSIDTVEDNAAFAKRNNFPFPLLCDPKREVAIAYGACESPKDRFARRISYLIDEQGKIARVYPLVEARNHASQVLADLADAQPS